MIMHEAARLMQELTAGDLLQGCESIMHGAAGSCNLRGSSDRQESAAKGLADMHRIAVM